MKNPIRLLPLLAALAAGPALGQVQAPAAVPQVEAAEASEPVPGPPPPLPDLTDPNSRTGEALTEPGPGSGIPKALRASGQKAGGPANDLKANGVARGPDEPRPDLARVAQGAELYHGNYCGKGQRGEGLAPVDALDAACQRHDACYDAAGRKSCACDEALRQDATAVSDSPGVGPQVREKALSVAEAASVMSCVRP